VAVAALSFESTEVGVIAVPALGAVEVFIRLITCDPAVVAVPPRRILRSCTILVEEPQTANSTPVVAAKDCEAVYEGSNPVASFSGTAITFAGFGAVINCPVGVCPVTE
jgi:hypothetical protein